MAMQQQYVNYNTQNASSNLTTHYQPYYQQQQAVGYQKLPQTSVPIIQQISSHSMNYNNFQTINNNTYLISNMVSMFKCQMF